MAPSPLLSLPLSLFIALPLLGIPQTLAQAQLNCYYGPEPSNIDPTMVACPGVDATNPGPCCRNDGNQNIDPCLSNGLCWSAEALFLYEGECTDRAFGAERCLANCRGTGNMMGSDDFYPVSRCYDGTFCCGWADDAADCCSSGTGKINYTLPTGGDVTFLGPLNGSTLVSVTDNSTLSSAFATIGNTTATELPKGYVKESAVIGVGVGFGVPLLLALATTAWLLLGGKRKAAARSATVGSPGYTPVLMEQPKASAGSQSRGPVSSGQGAPPYHPWGHAYGHHQQPAVEVSSEPKRHEIPG